MSKIIGLRELRENTDKYIDQVSLGKSFTVVRRSRPIFNISPVDEWGDEGVWRTAFDFTKVRKGGIPVEELRSMLTKVHKKVNR